MSCSRCGRVCCGIPLADEEPAFAEAIPCDVSVVLGTRAEVGAIALGVASDLSAGTVASPVNGQILGQASQDMLGSGGVGIEPITPPCHIPPDHPLHAFACCCIVFLVHSLSVGHGTHDYTKQVCQWATPGSNRQLFHVQWRTGPVRCPSRALTNAFRPISHIRLCPYG
jgi:hypothetical protein